MADLRPTRRTLLLLPWLIAAGARSFGQQQRKEEPANPATGSSVFEPPESPTEIPMKGPAGVGLERLNQVIRERMVKLAIPGASLAVARGGSLVLAHGYGWANIDPKEEVFPQTLFGLASVSKSLTAVTILKLIETGRLKLDAKAFELLDNLPPLPGDAVDPRIKTITIEQLLHHTGGWDRKLSGDANGFAQRVAQRMGVKLPITPAQLVRYMQGQKLDFDPGASARYSNFGYIVLGEVIARVTGQSYEEAVRTLTLRPLGLDKVRLDLPRGKGYLPGEAHRFSPRGRADAQGGHLLITMASGGWLASAIDLVRFLVALDGSRGTRFLSGSSIKAMTSPPPPPAKPRADGSSFGLGWDEARHSPHGLFYCKSGGLFGMHAHIEHTPDGIDWALLWNGGRKSESGEEGTAQSLVKDLRAALAAIEIWPEEDFFVRHSERSR
jgi:N-acyl-D-amino-acid deacylase